MDLVKTGILTTTLLNNTPCGEGVHSRWVAKPPLFCLFPHIELPLAHTDAPRKPPSNPTQTLAKTVHRLLLMQTPPTPMFLQWR